MKRRTVITARQVTAQEGTTPLPPPYEPGRRQFEPWPPYQSAVYRARIAAGKNDYANRVGLLNALALEGALTEVLAELKKLVHDLMNDKDLIPASTGGIDWHLGLAVYELLQHPNTPECQALWTDFEPVEPFIGIVGRAVDFFARWHRPEDAAWVDEYFRLYEQRFGSTAKLMHALERKLLERVETETHRGHQLMGIFREAREEPVRLRALYGAIEAYLRDGNWEGALVAMDQARAQLTDPESVTQFTVWAEVWTERIAEGIERRERIRLEALRRAKADLLRHVRLRLSEVRPGTRDYVRLSELATEVEAELGALSQ